MKNFGIHFTYPWLLFLFLFGAAVTALLYFRLSKKYRKNRNRITSMVLHLVVLALAVLTLAGTFFTYEIPNKDNQIILLVDMSDTENSSAEERNNFVRTVLDMGQYDGYSIGIVTFGYDQVLAVEMTDTVSVNDMMNALTEKMPDTSATDIAAALNYASTLFRKPESAKIVLITDGKETDEDARSVIRTVAAKGIKVDVANITSSYSDDDARLIGATVPDYHVIPGTPCPLSVSLQSNCDTKVKVELRDNGTLIETQEVEVTTGTQNVTFQHTFGGYGLHQISFNLTSSGDLLEQNNSYQTYLNLENYNNLLILEHQDGESEKLVELLTGPEGGYTATVKNITTAEDLPKTLEELCAYDQIILNNIANKDMPEGFDELLYTYVHECGGGLFTTGGADIDPNKTGDDRYVAHAYNRSDMLNTLYQQILPVQAIKYTPPIAVMVIVDRSGSMSATDSMTGNTAYDLALSGAAACLNAMSERDYFGLMTLDSEYETLLPLTPRSQESKIIKAINNARELGTTGGTVFPGAINRASRALLSMNVARRHVIIVTDGQVPQDQEEEYLGYIKQYNENYGITYSVVGIGVSEGSDAAKKMETATDLGHGNLYALSDMEDTISSMREDLNVPEIKEINYDTFYPSTSNVLSPLFSGVSFRENEEGKPTPFIASSLEGFFGTKVKPNADLILTGDYNVPLYAQWKFGDGMVGSFMCDLNGVWSQDFLTETAENKGAGKQFLLNAIAALLPTESIRESEIKINLKQDNYTNSMSVFASLEDGQRMIGHLLNMSDPAAQPIPLDTVTVPAEGTSLTELSCYVTSALDASTNYSRCNFVIKDGGVYELLLRKVDEAGTVLAEFQTYRTFSYSEEYDTVPEITAEELSASLSSLAEAGNGTIIADNEDPIEVFSSFVTAIKKTFDPRYVFMIVALVLFLADVAVRKFKFKWPHEIFRGHSKNSMKGGK